MRLFIISFIFLGCAKKSEKITVNIKKEKFLLEDKISQEMSLKSKKLIKDKLKKFKEFRRELHSKSKIMKKVETPERSYYDEIYW